MNLRDRIKSSEILTSQEKLIMGLMENYSMTNRQIIDVLMSEPFYLNLQEVFDAMNSLNTKRLLSIQQFVKSAKSMEVDVLLTFAQDWVLKI